MKSVPGNRLCILRSLQKVLKFALDTVVSIADLLSSLRRKMLYRFDFYKQFSTELCDILKKLDIFLSDPLKFHNTDLLIYFISNW